MIKIKCRCGKSEKSFKKEIGPFYIDECCEKAGFDEFGKLPEDYEQDEEGEGQSDEKSQDVDSSDEQGEEQSEEESEDAKQDMDQAVEMTNEDVQKKREDEVSYEGMSSKALMELCKQRKVQFTKKDTIKKLIERLEEADKK